MPDLFKEILPSILYGKKSVFDEDPDMKDYNVFMVNRALSLHMDCIIFANEMNKQPHLPKQMQYDYLMTSIRSGKRPFIPWPKSTSSKEHKAAMWYFGTGEQKALQALRILTEDQITRIVDEYENAHKS
jgi:hypothetical protein